MNRGMDGHGPSRRHVRGRRGISPCSDVMPHVYVGLFMNVPSTLSFKTAESLGLVGNFLCCTQSSLNIRKSTWLQTAPKVSEFGG